MNLAESFKALGDEKRLALLLAIASHDDVCACHLADKVDVTQSTLSHHLSILARAGLVRTRKEGKWVHYTADREELRQLADALVALAENDGAAAGADCC